MISRYSRKELVSIWSEENKYKIWLDVEIAAAEAMEKYKIIPKGVASLVKRKGKIKVKRIHDIEAKVKHDVIAFLTSITEQAGLKARYLHQGMTSSDVLDTTLNIQLVQSGNILLRDIDKILSVLKKQAKKYKLTPCIGRSHGIHAEPITFGLKLATYYAEFKRNKKRLEQAIDEISTCAISGAVGTFAHIGPNIEKFVAKKLGLKPEPISTQIIPRDRHAYFFSILGIIASSIERFAVEIRNLQRTEVAEVYEFFNKKQMGSSAMPHKKNPVLSENLTGLARLIRATVIPAMENVALWHERDISHSSVERNIGPDATVTLDFAISRMNEIVKSMKVNKYNMKKNLDLTKGLFFSQRVLLHLTEKGLKREVAYRIVQKCALRALDKDISFYDSLLEDKKIRGIITVNNLNNLFDFSYHTKKINVIFNRLLK